MSELRPLRGGCQCGRNRYIIAVPGDSLHQAEILFNTEPEHPYIRVPLAWFHSTTSAFYPDETHTLIRRVYTHPSQSYAKRQFCGYCGTPLSYWSENPPSEADYINLTLGSLLRDDLRDLEDMGLIPDASESDGSHNDSASDGSAAAATASTPPKVGRRPSRGTALRESYGVPWFDGLVEGTRLGRMRQSRGIQRSSNGNVRVEWEVVEYGGEDDDDEMGNTTTTPGKRKRLGSDVGENAYRV
ncbi:hypothetical protein GMORB2_2220 [Geosmithia morbida]|uniref:CENP-V/GFA domain-containing protein n=1 Tax=Geosmithia morbida TaxID=1094350 RepID=A0A9P4YT64_9HYPO|nr:uncharacterized protein GMORB2_2220 [Geosmithia morbida]KAF4121258.1 hypothetical protein GMORB2_2220 [Geosmithia morbida]